MEVSYLLGLFLGGEDSFIFKHLLTLGLNVDM